MPKSRICSESSILILYLRLLLVADCIVNHPSPGRDLTPCFSLRSSQWMKEEPLHNPTYQPLTIIDGFFGRPVVTNQTLFTFCLDARIDVVDYNRKVPGKMPLGST